MRAALEKLLAEGRDDALLRFSLGNACLAEGDASTAAVHFSKAVEHDPGYSAAWKLLGQSLAQGGRNAEAAAAWERGIQTAESRGDIQAAKEMRVFLKRLRRQPGESR
jgi:Tfp pilus assembly protein PilF